MPDVTLFNLDGVLIVPIQRELTDAEAETMQQRLLERLEETRAKGVIIDVSGQELVDSYFCRILRDTATMVRLMGATSCLVGLAPAVAITLTELGLDLRMVHTDVDLERGLAWLKSELADA